MRSITFLTLASRSFMTVRSFISMIRLWDISVISQDSLSGHPILFLLVVVNKTRLEGNDQRLGLE